jgi:hypothetical protein
MELWELAARYSFQEYEQYCREDPNLLRQIESIITDPSKGIKYFLGCQLSVDFVTQLVCDFTGRLQDDVKWLKHSLEAVLDGGRPRLLVKSVHGDQVAKETKEGRFSYVEPLSRKDCRLCVEHGF